MGATIRLLKLGDFVHQNANLQLDFRACDRRGVVSAQRAQRWFRCHRWNDHVDVMGRHFRCSICNRRPWRIRIVHLLQPLTFPEWMALERDWAELVKRLRNR